MGYTDTDYRPQMGAHCLVDLRFRNKAYLAGEPFKLDDVPDSKVRELHAARRIAFGPPSAKLLERLRARLEALTNPQASEAEAKAELTRGPAPVDQGVQAKLRAKADELRGAAAAKAGKRVSSTKSGKGKKPRGPVRHSPRDLRAAAGRVADAGEDLLDDDEGYEADVKTGAPTTTA